MIYIVGPVLRWKSLFFLPSRLYTRYTGDPYLTIPGGSVCGDFTAYPGSGNDSSQEEA